MGLIKEPLDFDFEFDPRPLTKEEKEQISSYIRAYKARHSGKQIPSKRVSRNLTSRKKVVA